MTHLKIVHGDATQEEIAALVIALASRAVPAAKAVRKPEIWRNPAHRMRKPLPVGQGAWRSSALPR
ncbi:acyl-CoA carboxylase subunit epsilon [Streptosporangium canum]|uniref:acyl-CoA carboxylase subunit epsilon n=1 Tax=Streptosporangium TaxID=2000 RepID=UPI0009DEE453|nr:MULTISPECIES: acyl-CoA carboxylase subunit epsilon [Streptosporangium]